MSETRRFSKKPVVIDAVQFDGTWPSPCKPDIFEQTYDEVSS